MKRILCSFLVLVQATIAMPQSILISAEPDAPGVIITRQISNNGKFPVSKDKGELKSFKLEFNGVTANHKLIINVTGAAIAAEGTNEYSHAERTTAKSFTFQSDIINKQITIKDHDLASGNETDLLKFKFIKTAGRQVAGVVGGDGEGEEDVETTIEPLNDYLNRTISNYELTPLGWVRTETSGMTEKEKRSQINVTHLFFDEYGNSLLGAIPQGVSNRQYVVHIIYKGFSDRQGIVRYSVKQKTGSFSSALNINNTGALTKLPNNFQSETEENKFDEWKEEVFPMGLATDDLSFDVIATTENEQNKPVKVILETHTIKMSPVYHATIDVGLVNSELKNSTYSLVDAPDGSGTKVIRESDRSPKGVVTIMATFYTSPIVIIEKALGKRIKKRIPNYKLTGRSFFDDHGFFERIYPTVGVSISSKSFENLFFGLNWEIARGLSVFGGGHWGKVNTFEIPDFVAGVTPVTQSEFDFYINTKWKIDWAYGVKLDILIVTNLFK